MLRSQTFTCRFIIAAVAGAVLSPLFTAPPAPAQDDLTVLDGRFPFRVSSRRENGEMIDLVRPLCDEAGQSTVQVYSDNKPVALGLVVHKDGYVVTKRSELSGDPIRVRLPDDRMINARVAAVRRDADLALLKADVQGLKPGKFYDQEPPVGQFMVTVARGGRPAHIGVVSVASRKIEATGRLGVQLENNEEGLARVALVVPDSGASEAGIQRGDTIVAIDGKPFNGSAQVMAFLRNFFPGENISLTIARNGNTVELNAQIREFGLMLENENDARLNGPRNSRLSGFDAVLQHDTVLEPDQCGGPVVDSRGRIIGLNIARAGRVASFALPSVLVNTKVQEMLTEVQAP